MTAKQTYPSIFSADGLAIKENDLLYTPRLEVSEYNKRRENEVSVKVYRVTKVDLRYRNIRVRCHKGCEATFNFEKSCPNNGLYKKKTTVEKKCKALRDESLVEYKKAIEKYTSLVKEVMALKVKFDAEPVAE